MLVCKKENFSILLGGCMKKFSKTFLLTLIILQSFCVNIIFATPERGVRILRRVKTIRVPFEFLQDPTAEELKRFDSDFTNKLFDKYEREEEDSPENLFLKTKNKLYTAVATGNVEALKNLLGQITPDYFLYIYQRKQKQILHIAGTLPRATPNQQKIMRLLLTYVLRFQEEDKNKILMLQDNEKKTVVHYLAHRNEIVLMRFILDNVSPETTIKLLSQQDEFGETPFHIAAETGNIDLLFYLYMEVVLSNKEINASTRYFFSIHFNEEMKSISDILTENLTLENTKRYLGLESLDLEDLDLEAID